MIEAAEREEAAEARGDDRRAHEREHWGRARRRGPIRGYRCVFVRQDKIAGEALLAAQRRGGRLPDGGAAGVAGELLLGLEPAGRGDPGAFKPDQYSNQANPERTTKQPGRRSGSRPAASWTRSSSPSAPAGRSPVSRATCGSASPTCSSSAPTPRARSSRSPTAILRTSSRGSARTAARLPGQPSSASVTVLDAESAGPRQLCRGGLLVGGSRQRRSGRYSRWRSASARTTSSH